MKFRKLIMGILLSIVFFNFTGIEAYAAEGTGVTQESNIEATADNQIITTESQSTTVDSQEVTTESQSTTDGLIETTEEPELTSDDEDLKADSEEVKEAAEVKVTKVVKETKAAKETKKVEKAKYTKAELRLLSALIYCEAQSESYNGKLAVAIVVMNRVRSNLFPDTVKGVIYQRYQFSPVTNGTLKRALAEYDNGKFTSSSEKACVKAAKAALSGEKNITVSGKDKKFGKYLYFSGRLGGYTLKLGNHRFK